VGVAIACTLQRLYPQLFALEKVNTLLNREQSVKRIRAGESWKQVVAGWEEETPAFEARRRTFLRY
jgi:hypothetical protein